MTSEKHRKRDARELAATEGISYTAALRHLDRWQDASQTRAHIFAVLERHSVFCATAAIDAAVALGIDEDDAIREVAAQLLTEKDTPCHCPTKADAAAAGSTYSVPVEFVEPPADNGFADEDGFGRQLFDRLGIYTAVDLRWSPLHIEGTCIARVDARTYFVAATIPSERSVPTPPGHPQPADGAGQAALVVARALFDLGYDSSVSTIDHSAIRLVPTQERPS